MKTQFDKYGFGLTNQQKFYQYYFQIDWDKKFWLYRFFSFGFGAGLSWQKDLNMSNHNWIETKLVGVFIDITVFNIRIGIYLLPIIYHVYNDNKEKKKLNRSTIA